MTLQHSETWPVNTVAVVQFKVDHNGRGYSTFMSQEVERISSVASRLPKTGLHRDKLKSVSTTVQAVSEDVCTKNNDNFRQPLSNQHFDLSNKTYACKIIETQNLSTTVEQDQDNGFESISNAGRTLTESNITNSTLSENVQTYEKIQVFALEKIQERSDDSNMKNNSCRRPSIKIDNWDLVYIQKNKTSCQKHSNNEEITTATCGCKLKSIGTCNEHTDCLLPEIPLDARKVTTLRRHYYPEGGWGWVIVVCSVLVHVLNNGTQLSCSQLVFSAADKFKTLPVHVAGEYTFSC